MKQESTFFLELSELPWERPTHKQRANGSKLTDEQRAEIRAKYAAGGITQAKLGEEYGVSGATIFCVLKPRRVNS